MDAWEGAGRPSASPQASGEGFEVGPSLFSPDENLDERFPDPREVGHILDADSSQTQVIAAVREGRDLVAEGPPGTGKSQTIANIIADSVREGKRVLFVAEKRAALDVVHARLEKCGLGRLCLELHSRKASRKHVYAELKSTLELDRPEPVGTEGYQRVRNLRDELNSLSALLHVVDEETGETPHGVMGRIAMLVERECPRPEFAVEGADCWSRRQFEERSRAVSELVDCVREHGREEDHEWRGAGRKLAAFELPQLTDRVLKAASCLRAIRRSLRTAATAVGLESGRERAVEPLMRRLEAFSKAPDPVTSLLSSRALVERPATVLDLCSRIRDLQSQRSKLLQQVIESALEVDWAETRLDLAAHGSSRFRWLNGPYRRAVKRLRSVWHGRFSNQLDERLGLLDRLIGFRKAQASVASLAQLGQGALGDAWRGDETDVEPLLPALGWVVAEAEALGSGEAVADWFRGVPDGLDSGAVAEDLDGDLGRWRRSFEAVVEITGLDSRTAFDEDAIEDVEFAVLAERLDSWSTNYDKYAGWLQLAERANRVSTLGLGEIRQRLADGDLDPSVAVDSLDYVRSEAVWRRMVRRMPELESIDGKRRTEKVDEFKELDRGIQELACKEVAVRHFESLPTGASGQIGVIRRECNKKKRHMALRKLLDQAGEAVAAIKPVFLMSPLSVAQFLQPGGLKFDLLLIDEASQVRPADALGAVLRARQMVVVGDQKQLPPTSFFDKQVEVAEEDELEDDASLPGNQVAHMESILTLCKSQAMEDMMLRWHYRSMHPSLIEVSNREFYDYRLVCPPSPEPADTRFGLSLVQVEGEYDRGGKRNNPKEAEAIVEGILAHAREHPDRTLGVVALSVAQRDAILDRLEYMRTECPELDDFSREGKDEALFVKNLENVQGDERDVIFISIGYGPDAEGRLAQNFGPVSAAGGERRLNVLFTRARRRCRVFSSIRHGQLQAEAVKHSGRRALKRFLEFAHTGKLGSLEPPGTPTDTALEEAVGEALKKRGYRVSARVGSAGFRIDLAVHDPDDEDRYLLAVACDGPGYHASSWARERDRQRQAVLEQKGWAFHRVWSSDWFFGRNDELEKIVRAIDKTRSARKEGSTSVPGSDSDSKCGLSADPEAESVGAKCPRVSCRPPVAEPEEAQGTSYREATFEIPGPRQELREAPLQTIAECVERVVEMEGPVHIEEVGRRLSRLWGYKRAGKLIQSRVADAVKTLDCSGRIRVSGAGGARFREPAAGSKIVVRDRSAVKSRTLRKVEMLPPVEVRQAILEAVKRNVGLSSADCAREVCHALGFKKTSADMRRLVEDEAERLVEEGRLMRSGEELRLAGGTA